MSRAEQFSTIRTEGGLLPPGLLARVAAGDSTLAGLTTDSYHLAGSERFGEVIARSWLRLTGAWTTFRDALAGLAATDAGTGMTRDRWLLVLFSELGYGRLPTARAIEIDGTSYPVSHSWGTVPIHLVGAGVDLDRRSAGVAGAARSSPHSMVQELLNRDNTRLWGFVSNGLRLRILHDNHSLTRQAFVEFDLQAMMDGEIYSDFVVLWLLAHQSRVETDPIDNCWLERWSIEAKTQGTRALDHLRDGVEAAIAALGTGFLSHPANTELRSSLQVGDIRPIDYYRQLLRVIYRMLFLLVAEERDLLLLPTAAPEARQRYLGYYSLRRVRDLADRRRGTTHADLWVGLQTVIRLLGSADGYPALGLPALGSFLFSDRATPALNVGAIANTDFLAALRALSGRTDDRGRYRQRFDYRNLGVEELGSVYESLLELHPEVNVPARTFALTHGGSERRTTGSHYTPPAILKQVLDFALDPAIARAQREADPEKALLDLRILDPACGSGHFLTAAAHRIARAVAAVRTGETEATPDEVRRALRDVVVRCLYGVDLNPMAVELCRVALWLETLEPGKPLSFLDHHIRVGNSLLGVPLGTTVARNRAAIDAARKNVEERMFGLDAERRTLGALDPRSNDLAREIRDLRAHLPELVYDSWADAIPDVAFKPTSADDRAYARRIAAANKRQRHSRQLVLAPMLVELPDDLVTVFDQLGATAEDSVAEVTIRAETYEGLQRRAEYRHLLDQADVWTAAWFWPLRPDAPPPPTQELFNTLNGNPAALPADTRSMVDDEVQERRLFHFEVAFPEVFTSERGGFSVICGNPPYLGGPGISGAYGERVLKFLKGNHIARTGGRVDLAAYFLRRGFDLLQKTGHLGFVTTNSISDGDTLVAGLETIVREWNGSVVDARRNVVWEGVASVDVSLLHLYRGQWGPDRTLNGKEVEYIGPTLTADDASTAVALKENLGLVGKGANPLGSGFQLDEAAMQRMLRETGNSEVVRPLYGAEDLTSYPDTKPRRWVIDFGDRSEEEASNYKEPFSIVERLVRTDREALEPDGSFRVKRESYRRRWWQFAERSARLHDRVKDLARVIVMPEASKTMLPGFLPGGAVYLQTAFIFAIDDDATLALLTSSFHWLWAARPGGASGMRTYPRYHQERCFETFARPAAYGVLSAPGLNLDEHRRSMMVERSIGMTKVYNLVNDSAETSQDVVRLRQLHEAVDEQTAVCYGWSDLDFGYAVHDHVRFEPRWLPRPEVQLEIVQRLGKLNSERCA